MSKAHFYPLPTDQFLGRSLEIKDLRQRLETDYVVLVDGEEGIGKFEVVKSYCQEYENQYDIIFTVTESTISMNLIAENMDVAVGRLPDVFQDSPIKWLMIIKDMGEMNDVFYLNFPVNIETLAPDHHVIFVNSIPKIFEEKQLNISSLTISPLSDHDISRLLKNLKTLPASYSLEDYKEIALFCKGNPLLSTHLSTYIKSSYSTIKSPEDFSKWLDERQFNDSAAGSGYEIYKQFVKYLVESELKLKNKDFPLDLYQALIYYDEFAIDKEWLQVVYRNFHYANSPITEEEFDKLLDDMAELGFLELHKDLDGTYLDNKHSLSPIKISMKPRGLIKILREIEGNEKILINQFLRNNVLSIGGVKNVNYLLSHLVYLLLNFKEQNLINPLERLMVYEKSGEFYFTDGKFSRAMEYSQLATEALVHLPTGTENENAAKETMEFINKKNKAVLYGTVPSKIPEALKLLQDCYDTLESGVLDQQLVVLHAPTVLLHLGFSYLGVGNIDKCIQLSHQVVDYPFDQIPEGIPDSDLLIIKALNNLGVGYFKKGELLKSIHNHKLALEHSKNILGDTHYLSMVNLQSLAIAYGVSESPKFTETLKELLKLLIIMKVDEKTVLETPTKIHMKVLEYKQYLKANNYTIPDLSEGASNTNSTTNSKKKSSPTSTNSKKKNRSTKKSNNNEIEQVNPMITAIGTIGVISGLCFLAYKILSK